MCFKSIPTHFTYPYMAAMCQEVIPVFCRDVKGGNDNARADETKTYGIDLGYVAPWHA